MDIAIVGGGISGLYCALELARRIKREQPPCVGGTTVGDGRTTPHIHLYEAREAFGGRIETWTIDLDPYRPHVTSVDEPYDESIPPERKRHFYRAEFGPMRIEPRDQPHLRRLLADLGISDPESSEHRDEDLIKFPPYTSEEPPEAKYHLLGEEAEQHSLLDMLFLAVRRICELINEDAAIHGRQMLWRSAATTECWKHVTATASRHRRYWKGELHDFIISLGDADYDTIRDDARINGVHLRNMGFWNLLSDVLSHLAVLRIRDWGSYYHLIGENPNAAEHLIVWLRNIKSSDTLRGIRGGMGLIVHKVLARLESDEYRDVVTLHRGHTLAALNHIEDRGVDRVQLHFEGMDPVVADEVVLALPKRPLERLILPAAVSSQLGKVQDIPLLKVFFVIDQPWWEDNRPPNRFAGDLPTREVHYAKSEDRTRGIIMLYTDRPALEFWTDYLTEDQKGLPRDSPAVDTKKEPTAFVTRQEFAERWILERNEIDRTSPKGINARLWRRFVQYARDYEHNEFTMERLLACGIRDWGKEPYGAAVHVWKPRAKPAEVAAILRAFPLDGSRVANVHICGDAYSDFQGFIEGALRSTAAVLERFDRDRLVGGHRVSAIQVPGP
jgi:hypothetical protein